MLKKKVLFKKKYIYVYCFINMMLNFDLEVDEKIIEL